MNANEMSRRLRAMIAEAEVLAEEMDDSGSHCGHCGLMVRTNNDDYSAKQALEACINRLAKLDERLASGRWQGRETGVVVTPAEEVRGHASR